MPRRLVAILYTLVLALLLPSWAQAQEDPQSGWAADLDAALPVDPIIIVGELDNGHAAV